MLYDLFGVSSLRAVDLFQGVTIGLRDYVRVNGRVLSNFGDRGLVRIDKPRHNWQTRAYFLSFLGKSWDFVRQAYMHVYVFTYAKMCICTSEHIVQHARARARSLSKRYWPTHMRIHVHICISYIYIYHSRSFDCVATAAAGIIAVIIGPSLNLRGIT